MKLKSRGPVDSRVEYRWRADQHDGFEKASLLFDQDGNLKGIDYVMPARRHASANAYPALAHEPPPRTG